MFNVDQTKSWRALVLTVVVFVVFCGGFLIGKSQAYRATAPANVDFSLFWDAYDKLHQNYLEKSTINDQNLTYGAINGMTESLGDPYTEFFDPTDAKLFNSDLAGSFDGIGVEVGVDKNGNLTVIAPLKGTPGDKAGLEAGDTIVKINGTTTAGMNSDDAVNAIRGPKGTKVTLTILRAGWQATKDFTITRDTINIPSVTWKLEDGDVAYINITQFDQTLSDQFDTVAAQILKSPAKKIILDVRGDPGGYLEECQDVAGWFLQPGQLITSEDFGPGKPQEQYKAQGNGDLANYPMVILIDGGSASASEILSGSLRDDRGIQLIGAQSYGKGSVQEVFPLEDGQSFLKITIAKWLTPKGYSISKVGLTPDVKVAMTDTDVAAGKDPQLDKALEIVGTLK